MTEIPIAREIIFINDAVFINSIENSIDDTQPYIIGLSYSDEINMNKRINLFHLKIILHTSPITLILLSILPILFDFIFATNHFYSCELIISHSIRIEYYYVGCFIFEFLIFIGFLICNYYNYQIPTSILSNFHFQIFHYLFTFGSFFWWIVIGWSIRFNEPNIYCEDSFTTFFSMYLGFHFIIFLNDFALCVYIYRKNIIMDMNGD